MNEPIPNKPTTSTGIDPRLSGLLSYLVPPLTGIVFYLIEKQDDVVRWHAAQSIVFGVAWVVAWVAVQVVSIVFSVVPILGWLAGVLLWIAIGLGGFIVWVVCLVKGYSGEKWRMPGLAQFADRVVASDASL